MADTKTLSPTEYSPAMDAETHEQTYRGFVKFTEIGTAVVICWVLALAVGGIKEAWLTAIGGVLASWVAAALGAFVPALGWKPAALVALGLAAGLFFL